MIIDIEKLREDLRQDCFGACFGAGFGGALFESFDIERADDEELIKMALQKGFDLSRYEE